MNVSPDASGLIVEGCAGSLALVTGRHTTSDRGQLDMAAWKQIVAHVVAADPQMPLRLVFCGGANQIAGYRLYYMLQVAKAAGVRRLVLCTDGVFWIDEATDWLIESGVDEIDLIVPGGQPSAALVERMRDLGARTTGRASGPRVSVRTAGPGAFPGSATIVGWRFQDQRQEGPVIAPAAQP